MTFLLRALGLTGPLMDETLGDGTDAGGAGVDANDDADPNARPADDGTKGEPKGATTEGMAAAITEGLAKIATPAADAGATIADDKTKTPDAATPKVEQTPTEKAATNAAALAAAETDPTKKAELQAAATKAQKTADDEKLKTKKADDFLPKAGEVLGKKEGARVHELHRYAKAKEDENAQLTAQVASLSQRSEALTTILRDTQTAPEELGALLDYNLMLKTGKFDDALAIVDSHRAAILKAMGKEAPGVDLLSEFPDLAKRVEEMQISRGDAIELANTRRRESARQQQQDGQHTQQQAAQEQQKVAQTALSEIEAWCADTAKKDIDYKAREAKLMPQIAQIMHDYPANLWLKTIQQLYGAVSVAREVPKVPAQPALRPNGATPGSKAPASMFDAIKSGLGYSAAN